MSQQRDERREAQLQEIATSFVYPPTPDITGAIEQRITLRAKSRRSMLARQQLIWITLIFLLILAGLFAVPQVRAAVIDFLQMGAIRILLTEPTLTSTPHPTIWTPPGAGTASSSDPGTAPATRVPRPTATPLASWLNLAGETSLSQAREKLEFPVRLPTYPTNLGSPDRVFLQDLGGQVVILVWLDPKRSEKVRLSLHQLGPGTFAQKGQPRTIQETTVKGQPALWTEGPYVLEFLQGNSVTFDLRQLVEGHVLLWTEGAVTYRLETDLPLQEAITIAESLE